MDNLLPTLDDLKSNEESNHAHTTDHSRNSPQESSAIEATNNSKNQSITDDKGSSPATKIDSVELSPTVATLVELAITSNNQLADSRETLVNKALDTLLIPTVGAEFDRSHFIVSTEMDTTVDCNSVLDRLLTLHIATNDEFENLSDTVVAAFAEQAGLTNVRMSLKMIDFDYYRAILDTLVADDNCPCDDITTIVEIAIRKYLIIQSDRL